MRIVFLGAVEFSAFCLREIATGGGDVACVLALDPELRGRHGDYVDLVPVARELGVPARHVRSVNEPETVAHVRELDADVGFVFGWSELLRADVLSVPRLGWVGSHPALLPHGRGRHPVTWALVEGLDRSGLTFFSLAEGADSGDILWQGEFPIDLDDDAATVLRKIEGLAAKAIPELLDGLERGTLRRVRQDESLATVRRKRTEGDRWIDWGQSTRTTYDLVRALARPYVGAVTRAGDTPLTVWRARLPEQELSPQAANEAPGTVLAVGDEGVDVRTGDAYLRLTEIDPAGVLHVGFRLEAGP